MALPPQKPPPSWPPPIPPPPPVPPPPLSPQEQRRIRAAEQRSKRVEHLANPANRIIVYPMGERAEFVSCEEVVGPHRGRDVLPDGTPVDNVLLVPTGHTAVIHRFILKRGNKVLRTADDPWIVLEPAHEIEIEGDNPDFSVIEPVGPNNQPKRKVPVEDHAAALKEEMGHSVLARRYGVQVDG